MVDLLEKLLRTSYFLGDVKVTNLNNMDDKGVELDLTFSQSHCINLQANRLEEVQKMIGNHKYHLYAVHDWIHIVISSKNF